MAASKTENLDTIHPGTGQHRKVVSGKGYMNIGDSTLTVDLNGRISTVLYVKTNGINSAEVIYPTAAQPTAGVLTFSRAANAAEVYFWYEIVGIG